MKDPWPLDKRRDDLRSSIYLAIVSGNARESIDSAHWIRTFRAEIKPGTFNKWWTEELAKYEAEQAERLTRIPPNSVEEFGK